MQIVAIITIEQKDQERQELVLFPGSQTPPLPMMLAGVPVPTKSKAEQGQRVKPTGQGFSFTARSQTRHVPLILGQGWDLVLARHSSWLLLPPAEGTWGVCGRPAPPAPPAIGILLQRLRSSSTNSSPLAAWWQNSQGLTQQHPQQTGPFTPEC